MRVEVTTALRNTSVWEAIVDDDTNVAAILGDESVAAVTIEYVDGRSFRYEIPAA